MATKKAAASNGAAKKTSKKGSKANPATTKAAKKATKASAGPAAPASAEPKKRGGRGVKVSEDQLRKALAAGPQSIANLAEKFDVGRHAVRSALGKMGSAVTSTGATVNKKFALAS